MSKKRNDNRYFFTKILNLEMGVERHKIQQNINKSYERNVTFSDCSTSKY